MDSDGAANAPVLLRRPARTHHAGAFTVLVWDHNILTRLAGAGIPR